MTVAAARFACTTPPSGTHTTLRLAALSHAALAYSQHALQLQRLRAERLLKRLKASFVKNCRYSVEISLYFTL